MNRATLDAIRAARRGRKAIVLRTDLASGAQGFVEGGPLTPSPNPLPGGARASDGALVTPSPLRGEGRGEGAIRTGIVESGTGETFIHAFRPTPRLIIVGAVHIAQKLAPLARLADFAVHVVDPRAAFARAERFPDVELVNAWPDKAVAALTHDSATAVVTLTHDPKLDDPALAVALGSPAFYIGALGSRKTHAARLERLKAEGFAEADLARIHAPVGLTIGAISPGEIAVSIMAEIVAVLHDSVLVRA